MSAIQGEIFDACRAVGVPEDKAIRAAVALARRDEETTGELLVIRWMVGLVLALQIAIFIKVFLL